MSNLKTLCIDNVCNDINGGGISVDDIYPVGSIYMSTNNVNPANLFGGEWEKIENRFLLASGDKTLGAMGGEENTTLTTSEIPSHTHGSKPLTGAFSIRRSGTSDSQTIWANGIMSVSEHAENTSYAFALNSNQPRGDKVNIDATHEHNSVGEGQAHNNMPPYLVINVWTRIS